MRKYTKKKYIVLLILFVFTMLTIFGIILINQSGRKCTEFEYCWDVKVITEQLENNIVDPEFVKFFDRDPIRVPPKEKNVIVSPTDGKILSIKDYTITIRMSLLDVHVQRIPISGKVISVEQGGSGFLPGNVEGYSNNVQTITTLDTEIGTVVVKQITGNLVRRIQTYVKPGDDVVIGDKLGRILLGSTVVIVLPKNVEITINKSQKVYGGETVIARYDKLNTN